MFINLNILSQSRRNHVSLLGVKLLAALLFAIGSPTYSQEKGPELTAEMLQSKIRTFAKSHHSSSLFLHVDKTIYTENEPVWFSAYLLNRQPADISLHTTLTVFLFMDETKEVVTSGRFFIKEGIGAGNLTIPDTIAAGKYHLFAYTDLLDKEGYPLASFSMPIDVKSAKPRNFSTQVTILDSIPKDGIIKASINVKADGEKDRERPEITCIISKDTLLTFELKREQKIIDIPSKFLGRGKSTLVTILKYKNQKQVISTILPNSTREAIKIRFFPEGGDLVNGLPCIVSLEAKKENNQPLEIEAELYDDETQLMAIRTNTEGVGRFKITPDINNKYMLKVKAGKYFRRDTIIKLPKISESHTSLHIEKAVVNDTLTVDLLCKNDSEVQLLINDYRGNYTLFKTKGIKPKKTLHIPVNALSKGVASLTLFDSLGRPLAERSFFAHFNDTVNAQILPDSTNYTKRGQAKVNIALKNSSGSPLKGLFSVAVVQSNRLVHPFLTIENHVFLREMLDSNTNISLKGDSNYPKALENMLLVNGWTRYTWKDIVSGRPSDSLDYGKMPLITGQVTRFKKPLKDSVTLFVMAGSNTDIIETDKKGNFQLPNHSLFVDSGKKVLLMVSANNNNGFSIQVDKPYDRLNQFIADSIRLKNTNIAINQSEYELKGLENTIQLQEVNISSQKSSDGIYGYHGKPGPNACGDYVDEFDYLNYEYSVNKYQPIVGKQYKKRINLSDDRAVFKVEPVSYHGCTIEEYTGGVQLEGIYGEREFYGVDISQEQPQYISTLFWQPMIVTDEEGKASFKFATGDIKGQFDIIVQGLVENNVFSQTKEFSVK